MRAISTVLALVLGAALTLFAGQAPPSPPPASPVFTTAQAAAGQASYQTNCASCHLVDLAGQNEAPQLAGANFMTTWRARQGDPGAARLRSVSREGALLHQRLQRRHRQAVLHIQYRLRQRLPGR